MKSPNFCWRAHAGNFAGLTMSGPERSMKPAIPTGRVSGFAPTPVPLDMIQASLQGAGKSLL